MGILGLRKIIASSAILACVSGCSSVRSGLGYREVSGTHKVYHVDRMIPFVRVQGNKELGKNLEGYVRGDFSCGRVDADPRFLHGSAEGHFESLGSGLSYFLNPNFSVDVGGELFYADFDMNFDDGRLKLSTPDSVFGWGLNFGATFEKALGKNAFLFASGGYNLTDNITERCDCDFSGFYGVVGFGLRW